MKIAGIYSFKSGEEVVKGNYSSELSEIGNIICSIDSERYRTKISREKTIRGRELYNPKELNKAFTREFLRLGWKRHRIECIYSSKYYTEDFRPEEQPKNAFREIDFTKNRLGVEVQFGKYAFMVYNVCAKMTIFRNLNVIDAGIEIVPVKSFADEMSTGVSYFEQFVWDLEARGVSDIDIPVLVLGITARRTALRQDARYNVAGRSRFVPPSRPSQLSHLWRAA
ncbi:BglII/BstYI family type II restriction endonuclease [Chloracidobacterium thermophilum]|uniref:BglII/BstYI family type II restriction endonuclease n=1 Tax=Chloracidobacterium thermophilum TaxID=458033 RepID=UPI0009E915BF|nr:BglII/BstYI family type II restriction endonuclease [Chloracidobacterium thermophilum]